MSGMCQSAGPTGLSRPMISPGDQGRVTEALRGIPGLSRARLIESWTDAHSHPPPKGLSRRLLEYSAACQIQVKALGGLTPATKRKLRRTVKQAGKNPASPGMLRKSDGLAPGVRLVREWHGRTHTVDVAENGFRYDGEIYKSLSKVACAITGTRWSGPRFFGL